MRDELGRPELIHKNLTLGEIYMLWAKEKRKMKFVRILGRFIEEYILSI